MSKAESLEEASTIDNQIGFKEIEKINSLRSVSCRIVSSTDYHFAVIDTFERNLDKTRKSLLVSAPYLSKCFINLLRKKGIEVKFLTKQPEEREDSFDWRCKSIEALKHIARTQGQKLEVRCRCRLHSKFIVIDRKIVLDGSVNPTNSGFYENDEIFHISTDPTYVRRFVGIFNKLWNDPRTRSWRKVKDYHGYRGYSDHSPIQRKIFWAIKRYFERNSNQPTRRDILCERIKQRGYKKDLVIDTVKEMTREGLLYEPKTDYLKGMPDLLEM